MSSEEQARIQELERDNAQLRETLAQLQLNINECNTVRDENGQLREKNTELSTKIDSQKRAFERERAEWRHFSQRTPLSQNPPTDRVDVIMEYRVIQGGTPYVDLQTNDMKVDIQMGKWLNKYEIYNPVGDGNCLFRALSILQHGTEHFHLAIRFDTLCKMLKDIDEYINVAIEYDKAIIASQSTVEAIADEGKIKMTELEQKRSTLNNYSIEDVHNVAEIGHSVSDKVFQVAAKVVSRNVFVYRTRDQNWFTFPGTTDTEEIYNWYLIAKDEQNVPGHVYGVLKRTVSSKDNDPKLSECIQRAPNRQSVHPEVCNTICTGEDITTAASYIVKSIHLEMKEIYYFAGRISILADVIHHVDKDILDRFTSLLGNKGDVHELSKVTSEILNWFHHNKCDRTKKEYIHIASIKHKIDLLVKELYTALPQLKKLQQSLNHVMSDNDKDVLANVCSYLDGRRSEGQNISVS